MGPLIPAGGCPHSSSRPHQIFRCNATRAHAARCCREGNERPTLVLLYISVCEVGCGIAHQLIGSFQIELLKVCNACVALSTDDCFEPKSDSMEPKPPSSFLDSRSAAIIRS